MKRLILAAAVSALTFVGCKQEKEVAIEAPKPIKQVFKPESSGKINATQMQRWVNVNNNLDILTRTFSDSLATKDPAKYGHYKRIFTKKQDSICVASGLTGGYEEYSWITKHMGKPINSPLLDSLNLVAK